MLFGKLVVPALLLLSPTVLAQDLPATQQTDDEELQVAPFEVQDTNEEALVVDENEEETEVEEEEDSPIRFIPTEEVSQDLGVSFPVDI